MPKPRKERWNSPKQQAKAGRLGGMAGKGASKVRNNASDAAKISHAAKKARKAQESDQGTD